MSNAILLCGGCGRRMSPIPNCNKSLLNIRGNINLINILKILSNKDIKDIVIATNPLAIDEIEEVLRNNLPEGLNLNIHIVISKDYYKGCNNVVTLKSVLGYIEDTYILETDQYYLEESLDFLRAESYDRSYFFTQKRSAEDWGVISDPENHNIIDILHENPNSEYACLAGISYFTGPCASYLREALSRTYDTEIYWEELLEGAPDLYEYEIKKDYAIEFDNISDLVNKSLMEPQDIANLVDDNHQAEKLSSMTNTTYKVTVEGKPYALRIPGYGTDKFVDHHREKEVESHISTSLRPESYYYSNDDVKLTEYLEGYTVLESPFNIKYVMRALNKIHRSHIPTARYPITIDLKKEVRDYESIFLGEISFYDKYDETKHLIFDFLDSWFSKNVQTICHRDLVPLNIMINPEKDVKFIDWEYSGLLSEYWDIASFCCEYADEYDYDLESVVDWVYSTYPRALNMRDIYRWIAVVDFVWSSWSLAKQVLGDDVLEYGQHRYDRAVSLINKYLLEESESDEVNI